MSASDTMPPPDDAVIRCVVYAAKSTEDKRGSIPDQLRECRALIEQNAARRVVAEYSDEAFSAFRANRGPGLIEAMQRAEDLAREHGTAELWAQHSDRLARGDGKSARHAVEIGLWALKRDVKVRTIQDPDTFRDLLYAVVTGQRNHEDSRRKGLAVSAGQRRAAARGDFLGHKPDGYRPLVEVDESGAIKKRLVMDTERQPVIAMILRMGLRRRDMGVIARAVNDAGWLTKPLFRKARPMPWTAQRVRDVLINPRYAGLSVIKGEVVASGHWPAYITPAQHLRLKARKRGPMRPAGPREAYLLRRLMTCGRCGGTLIAFTQAQRKDGTFDRSYACTNNLHSRAATRCRAPRMSAALIEAMLVANLPSLLDPDQEDDRERTAVTAPTVGTVERQRVIDAVLGGDLQRIDATLASLIDGRAPEATLLRRSDRSRRGGLHAEAVLTFEVWAEQEQIQRTETTREAARTLNETLRTWFSRIAVTTDPMTVTIATTRRSTAVHRPPRTAEIQIDLQEWARSPQARWLRRRYRRWNDADILAALQDWTDIHGRSPKAEEWKEAELDHPVPSTVRSHFKTWDHALKKAGLKPAGAGPRGGYDAGVPLSPSSLRIHRPGVFAF
jgi:DNA invertase Pin-like site-specific DNA recombinase